MAGPWEQYQKKPWEAYAEQAPKADQPSFGQMLKQEMMASLPGGVLRGGKDVIDTGAELLAKGYDKLTEADAPTLSSLVTGQAPGEAARIRAMNQAGKAEFEAAKEATGNRLAPEVGRVGGQVLATSWIPGAFAKGAQFLRAPASLVEALRTAGMSSGGLKGAQGLATRVGAGAVTGGAMAGAANPEDADTGALIGGALPIVAPVIGKGLELGRRFIGQTTGVGDEALRQAFVSGKAGGAQSEAFKNAMRGESSIDDVLTSAKQNIQAMGAQRQQAYRAGMANIKADKTVLDMSEIAKSADDALGMTMFKGQVKNPAAAEKLQQVRNEVMKWRTLDPAEYHTPEGLDALKQKVGDILESIPFEQRQARTAVGNVYNSIKSEVQKQAPEYSKVMKDYGQASELIREIERSLSIGQKSAAETGMRKLQSLMRNNVSTSYGYRTQLAEALEQAGGKQMMPQLAGQTLNEWTPRGIQRATSGTGSAALALTGNLPQAAGLAAISSPRLMGEAFYGAGRAAGKVDPRLIEALRRSTYMTAPQIPGE